MCAAMKERKGVQKREYFFRMNAHSSSCHRNGKNHGVQGCVLVAYWSQIPRNSLKRGHCISRNLLNHTSTCMKAYIQELQREMSILDSASFQKEEQVIPECVSS